MLQQNLVLVIIRRPGDGTLLFFDGFLKRGDRLEVVSQLVMKVTQAVVAPAQRSVMPCLVRMRLDELFEDVDGHLQRGKRLVILMGPVLDIGDQLISFAEVFPEPGDRWMRGDELGPVLERFLQGFEGLIILAVRHLNCGDVVMGEGQQVEKLDRLGAGGHLLEERLANLLDFLEATDRIGIVEPLAVDKAQDVDDLGQPAADSWISPGYRAINCLLDRSWLSRGCPDLDRRTGASPG